MKLRVWSRWYCSRLPPRWVCLGFNGNQTVYSGRQSRQSTLHYCYNQLQKKEEEVFTQSVRGLMACWLYNGGGFIALCFIFKMRNLCYMSSLACFKSIQQILKLLEKFKVVLLKYFSVIAYVRVIIKFVECISSYL